VTYPVIFTNGITAIDVNGGNVKFQGGDAVLDLPPHLMRNAGGEHFHQELQYLALLKELVNKADGDVRPDRTGTGTYSVFGRQMRFNLEVKEFPLLTTKTVNFKAMFAELAWMLRGETNINTLDAKIWDEWADENGDLGPVYGAQWRRWPTGPVQFGDDGVIDQLGQIIQQIKDNPESRRHVVSAWNVAQLPDMKLSPCHVLFQFYVDGDRIDLQLYQRSADIFLGVPFNVASYALLLEMVAAECGLRAGEFIHTFGDLHLYANHVEQAKEQLSRVPTSLPEVVIRPGFDLFNPQPDDVILVGYHPHPAIKAKVSV
jgi:thymidylate synthase